MSTATCPPDSVAAVARRVVRLVNEVVAGARPGHQVTPLFPVHLRGMIRRVRPEPGAVARLRHLRITSHNDGVYEIVAVCTRAQRVTVLGLQLTRGSDGRWEITDVAHPQFTRPQAPLGRCERSGACGAAANKRCDGPAPSCPTCRVGRHGGDPRHG